MRHAHSRSDTAELRSVCALFILVALVCALAWSNADRALTHYARACAEPEPCWNWRTMGNHKRGIVLTNGRRLVVGPVSFDGYRRERRIDWTRTPRLRGDNR